MRLIDADALLDVVQYRIVTDDLAGIVIQRCVEITREKIQQMPTIDAKPVKHGRWAWDERFSDYTCSECHNWDLKTPNYCSNCGARMDGVADG